MLLNSPSTAGGPSSLPEGSFVSTGPQASVFNKARLLKLKMKKFNGDICHWQEF